jgi:hypothetical protein
LDDYIDRHYVFKCIWLSRWVHFWNEPFTVLVVNP